MTSTAIITEQATALLKAAALNKRNVSVAIKSTTDTIGIILTKQMSDKTVQGWGLYTNNLLSTGVLFQSNPRLAELVQGLTFEAASIKLLALFNLIATSLSAYGCETKVAKDTNIIHGVNIPLYTTVVLAEVVVSDTEFAKLFS